MKWKMAVFAAAVGLAAHAGALELPPQPLLGEPLSKARDWCSSIGAEITTEQQPGIIYIYCKLSEVSHYTFGGMEMHGYRIESKQHMFLAPYEKLVSDWDGPYYCKPGYGMPNCELVTRDLNGVVSRAQVYFENKQDQHAMWTFRHMIKRQ